MGIPARLNITNNMIFGVCAGTAKSLGIKPSVVRIATVIAFLIWGMWPIFWAYIAAAIIMPDENKYGY